MFLTQRDAWRVRRAAKRFLIRQNSDNADAILSNGEMFGEFCDHCLAKQAEAMGGPIADAVKALIESFVNDPEKWIAIIKVIISLFSTPRQP